jgi:L-threonylcarbamoyladenylate synthase
MRAAAIERIFQIKGRSFHKPLPLIASRMDTLRSAVGDWPSNAQKLADAFWPGPLTLILPASPALPSMLHAQTGKIAVRISSHPVATALAEAVGGLLVSTSANPSGEPACSNPEDLSESLLHRVDGVLHGGRLPGGAPSTIVDVSVCPPRLVREGVLPWDEVKNRCEK